MSDNDSQPSGSTTPDPNAPAGKPDDAAGAGSQAAPDELSVLKSRYQGQSAKVDALSQEKARLEAALAEAQAKLGEAQKGVLDKDEALKAQIAAKDAEIEAIKRERNLTRIEAKYPETFAVLGEDAANLSEVKLAENEARLKGVAAGSTEPPTPIGSSPSRTGQRPAAKPRTIEDVKAQMATEFPSW
jgi:seryl-tRNA synthetase